MDTCVLCERLYVRSHKEGHRRLAMLALQLHLRTHDVWTDDPQGIVRSELANRVIHHVPSDKGLS